MATLGDPARLEQRRRRFRENLEGWLFISPWLLGFILFTAGPMIASLGIAMTEWDLIAPQTAG